MKNPLSPFCLGLCVALATGAPLAVAAPNIDAHHAQTLHFARGATSLLVRGHLKASQHRFYSLPTRARQKLRISAASTSKNGPRVVPLIFVTPPRGHFNGAKTALYATNFTRVGSYRIEVATNLMASNARSGGFTLRVSAR